jgi:hypothetical protein
MKVRNLLTVVMFTALLLEPSAFAQKSPQPLTAASELSNRVLKLIKLVEENPELTCDMRYRLVKRLRALDDAIEAGNRSAARALVMAWTSEARSYQQAALLSAAHGAILHQGLQGFIDEIGEGWPTTPGTTRKWDPLPACHSGGTSLPAVSLAATASGTSCPALPPEGSWDSEDTLIVLKSFLHEVPEVGGMLAGILEILWPSGKDTEVSAIIDRTLECVTQDDAAKSLIGLHAAFSPSDGYLSFKNAWMKDCALDGVPSDQWPAIIAASPGTTCKGTTQSMADNWRAVQGKFVSERIWFQTTSPDYQLKLLPLFVQYETLYMSFLREGILMSAAWKASGLVGEDTAGKPASIMADELNPAFVDVNSQFRDASTGLKAPDRGINYVNWVYNRGLAAYPEATGDKKWSKWTKRNAYIRDKTLTVLDFRDTWKFLDPAAFPEGVEGGVKLTRMLYSDPVGHKRDDDFASFQPPANVLGPLTELTVFSQRATTADKVLQYGSMYAVSAIKSTNPPTAGPARSGEITGDATHDGTTMAEYLDLRVNGPVTEVRTYYDARDDIFDSRPLPSAINFKLASTGDWIHTGGAGFPTLIDEDYHQLSWNFPGHVLAAVKAMGIYTDFGKDTQTTDSVILGFRLHDSFFPSGALVSTAFHSCMNVALNPGAQVNAAACSGGPGQIWAYDTNMKAVTIGGGQFCLRAAGATSGSAVVIGACTGSKNEQWELVPNETGVSGMLKSVESGLVMTATGLGTTISISLTPPGYGSFGGYNYQMWTATSPLQGEVHAIGSGRCLDVKNDGTAEGTPVQISDCNGGRAQAWTYNEVTRTLSAHQGTNCLNAPSGNIGAELQIMSCSNPRGHQEWVFNPDRTITHVPTGYVLDVKSGGMTAGSLVVLASPVANKTSQQWSWPSRRGGNVHAMYAGKCLDALNLVNGTPAQISDCLASPAPGQEWTYHPLTHRITAHGDGMEHCLSISGTAVVVNACLNDPNQLWTLQSTGVGGTIASTPSIKTTSPKCLTLQGTGTVTASGAKVIVQTCASAPADPNQQWIWP